MWGFKKNILKSINLVENTPNTTSTTKFCFTGRYSEDDTLHNPPGGVVTYINSYGQEVEQSGIFIETGVITIWAVSIVGTIGVNQVNCTE